jgi:hypothetical protein
MYNNVSLAGKLHVFEDMHYTNNLARNTTLICGIRMFVKMHHWYIAVYTVSNSEAGSVNCTLPVTSTLHL